MKVIFANNTRYCDKESANGHRTFLKMAVEYAIISQEGSNFCKETAKKRILPPKFQKVRFEMHKKFTNIQNIYGIYRVYRATSTVRDMSAASKVCSLGG